MSTTSATLEAVEPRSAPRLQAHWRWIPAALLLLAVWAWAMAGCADEWRDNPMYSYGWFVPPLMIFFAWRRLDEPFPGAEPLGAPRLPSRAALLGIAAALLALLVLPLELLRNELPDDRLNNWTIAFLAVGLSLWAAYCVGGRKLLLSLAFPIAFFLTAVAWPKRYENPVTVGLQKFVATVIVEVLHVLGIHANPQGTTIYLRDGPVGIAEACSGIRSLQASLMISLAIGELFFLRFARRLALIALCAGVAMVLNLGRTLALCLITEYHGADAMRRAHDPIGDGILIGLPLVAWLMGKLLSLGGGSVPTAPLPRKAPPGETPPTPYWRRLWDQSRALDWRRMPNFAPALVIGLAGFMTYHVWLTILDLRNPPQQAPFFTVQAGPGTGTEEEEMNPDVLSALSPTQGGTYIRHEPRADGGQVHLYHFFWKPAAANRWVTGHRPDICMPAGGWKKDGEVTPVQVEFNGQELTMYAFRFAGVGQRALQLWGIWRNGEPIHMDFFDNPTLEWSLLTGKSRSAVEVVSAVVPYAEGEPPIELAKDVLRAVMTYDRSAAEEARDTQTATPAAQASASASAGAAANLVSDR